MRSSSYRAAVLAAVGALAGGAALADPQLQTSPLVHNTRLVPPSGGGAGAGLDGAPASYTLRPTYVTSVKNQGGCGSCWAFATYGSMESNILMQGGPPRDLSENHLKNYHGFDLGPCEGGNVLMSLAYLSRLDGPVDESDDPYHAWDDRPSPGGPRQYFLRSCPLYDTPAEIKDAVMNQGALHTSMLWDSGCYNSGDHTYYYSGAAVTNHAVAIVGWDDSKPVGGAPGNGAWQVKNSWGAGWGDNGYFWISYYDTAACAYGASLQADPPETVERVYSHDEFGTVAAADCPYALNVFQTAQEEVLTSVGFYTQQDGAGYDLRVYDTFGGAPSGLLAQKTGTIDTQGFHVVDLDAAVALGSGDDFAIYLHLTSGGTHPQSLDLALPTYSSSCTANPGESYYSFDGAGWTDLTTVDPTANFSIKAYTIPEPGALLLVGVGGGFAVLWRRRTR